MSRLVLLLTLLILAQTTGRPVGGLLLRWDVVHFVGVSQSGYTSLTETAFFPGLPLLMAAFRVVGVPALASGTILALIGSGMAAWGLYRLAGGSVQGTVAVWAWSFAPMAVFTFVPYTEALFCACAFWSFVFARQDRWAKAGLLAGAACLFRVSGLFLIGALGLVALAGFRPARIKRVIVRIAWLGIPTAVLVAYAAYLKLAFGSWTTWFTAQAEGWDRGFNWPGEAIQQTLYAAGLTGPVMVYSVLFRWELLAFCLGLVVVVLLFIRRKIPEAGWVGIQIVAFSFQIWLISVARAILLWFPVFTLVGEIGRGEQTAVPNYLRRAGVIVLLISEGCFMVWWALRFFNGAWAG